MATILTPKCSAELGMLIFLLPRDGTTDITRTVHWGTPSAFQKVSTGPRVPYAPSPKGHPSNHFTKSPFILQRIKTRPREAE